MLCLGDGVKGKPEKPYSLITQGFECLEETFRLYYIVNEEPLTFFEPWRHDPLFIQQILSGCLLLSRPRA